jgi:predicted oxidoreductase (fatty acid repression mutant protein)
MQQSRAVVLTGAAHERLWDVVTEAWNKGVEEEGEFSSMIPLANHGLPSWR